MSENPTDVLKNLTDEERTILLGLGMLAKGGDVVTGMINSIEQKPEQKPKKRRRRRKKIIEQDEPKHSIQKSETIAGTAPNNKFLGMDVDAKIENIDKKISQAIQRGELSPTIRDRDSGLVKSQCLRCNKTETVSTVHYHLDQDESGRTKRGHICNNCIKT